MLLLSSACGAKHIKKGCLGQERQGCLPTLWVPSAPKPPEFFHSESHASSMFNFGRTCRALKSKQVHQVFQRLRQDFRDSSTKKAIFCFYSHPHDISKNNWLAALVEITCAIILLCSTRNLPSLKQQSILCRRKTRPKYAICWKKIQSIQAQTA